MIELLRLGIAHGVALVSSTGVSRPIYAVDSTAAAVWVFVCVLASGETFTGGGGYLLIFLNVYEALQRIKQVFANENRTSGARFVTLAISQTGLEVSTCERTRIASQPYEPMLHAIVCGHSREMVK